MNQQGKTETLVSAALPDETVGNVFVDNPRITARDVNVFYGDKQAIDRVTLDIAEKQVISFIGPSGCGKSTFLRCLNRMNDTIDICRIEGEIALDGKNIYAPDVDVVPLRARVGMVFQKPNPFPKSIYDNVAYGPRIHGLAAGSAELDEIVEMSLERAGLWNEVKDRLQQPGTGLSGGQQQRLCIAGHCREPGGDPDGRAMLGTGSDRDGENRGADRRAEQPVHHRDRDPLHAAGGAGVTAYGLFSPRQAGRGRRNRADVHHAAT